MSQRDRHQIEAAIEHRRVDDLARAGFLAGRQGEQNADDRRQSPGGYVGDLDAGKIGRAAGGADQVENSRHGEIVCIVSGGLSVGAVQSVSSQRRIDQTWIEPAQLLVAEIQAVHYSGAEAFD